MMCFQRRARGQAYRVPGNLDPGVSLVDLARRAGLGMQFVGRYMQNSTVADSPEDQALREACKRNELTAVIGVSERSGGSLYLGQWIYGPDGEPIARRRKLKPTHVERTVFGEGAETASG